MFRPGLCSAIASSSRAFSSTAPRRVVDHYAALHLPRNASRTQIKAKFYELSKKYHPDAATGSAEKFHKINEAYHVLGNVSRRSAYDAELSPTLRSGVRSGNRSGGPHHGGAHSHSPEGRKWKAGKGTWGKAAPGAQWTGRRRVDPNLGGGMGMGGTGGLGTDWAPRPIQLKTGADAWKGMRTRINQVRNDEDVKGESALSRFLVVGLMVAVAWAAAAIASAQEVEDMEELD